MSLHLFGNKVHTWEKEIKSMEHMLTFTIWILMESIFCFEIIQSEVWIKQKATIQGSDRMICFNFTKYLLIGQL